MSVSRGVSSVLALLWPLRSPESSPEGVFGVTPSTRVLSILRTRALASKRALAITSLLTLGAACAKPAVDSRSPPSRSHVAPPDASTPPLEPDDVQFTADGIVLRLRIRRTANLTYELSCMAHAFPCSAATYQRLWKTELGWDAEDDAALRSWAAVADAYRGLSKTTLTPALPIPVLDSERSYSHADQLDAASIGAKDTASWNERLGLVLSTDDRRTLSRVLARFEPRFAKYWAAHVGELISFVDRTRRMEGDVRAALSDLAVMGGGSGIAKPLEVTRWPG